MLKSVRIGFALGFGTLITTGLPAQHPLNLGFETPGIEGYARPWGWTVIRAATGGEISMDSAVTRSGRRSLRLAHSSGEPGTQALRYWIPPHFAWGRQVHVTGWVRGVRNNDVAHLVLEAYGAGLIDSDTASTTPTTSDTEWQRLELEIAVDSTAHSVLVTVMSTAAEGNIWFDDLEVRVDGRTWDSAPVASVPTREDLGWLRQHVSPLNGVDPVPSELDLDTFARIVGDARVVSLGEATHGTSEFFRMKHRLVQFLVRELGFRVFLIEANQLAVEAINTYVRGGPGDARAVMRTMFAVWNTYEMLDMIDWMRAHNLRHPDDMVEFIGFDMQDPSHPIDSLAVYLNRAAPELRTTADSVYRDYRAAWAAGQYPWGPDSVRAGWRDDAQTMWELISSRRADWLAESVSAADSSRVEWAVQNANVVRQAALSAFTGELRTRDSAMAENIRWSLARRDAGARAIVWAHDAHVSKAAGETANYYQGFTMGSFLRGFYSEDYRPIGLLTFDGQYTGWLRGTPISVDLFPAPPGALEEALHRIAQDIGNPVLIADLRRAMLDLRGAWLSEPRLIRLIGFAAEDWGFATPISVGHQFDSVIFVDSTTPSRLVGRP